MSETPPLDLDFELVKHLEAKTLIGMVLTQHESRCLDDDHDRRVVLESLANVLEAWTAYRAAMTAFRMGADLSPEEILQAVAALESGYVNRLLAPDEETTE